MVGSERRGTVTGPSDLGESYVRVQWDDGGYDGGPEAVSTTALCLAGEVSIRACEA